MSIWCPCGLQLNKIIAQPKPEISVHNIEIDIGGIPIKWYKYFQKLVHDTYNFRDKDKGTSTVGNRLKSHIEFS